MNQTLYYKNLPQRHRDAEFSIWDDRKAPLSIIETEYKNIGIELKINKNEIKNSCLCASVAENL